MGEVDIPPKLIRSTRLCVKCAARDIELMDLRTKLGYMECLIKAGLYWTPLIATIMGATLLWDPCTRAYIFVYKRYPNHIVPEVPASRLQRV